MESCTNSVLQNISWTTASGKQKSSMRRRYVSSGCASDSSTGLVPDCIQIYLDMLSEGTIAEGAHIEAEFLPVKVRCRDCGRDGEITPHHLACPHCGSLRLQILSGKEFYIKSMEVDIDGDKSTAPDHGLE